VNLYYFKDPVAVHKTFLVRDEYGQHREVEPEPFWTGKASVQPYRATEALVERDTDQEWLNVYFPVTVELDATMQLVYEDEFYQIDGKPERWFFGSIKHVKAVAWKVRH
jgi:hypothetical protein